MPPLREQNIITRIQNLDCLLNVKFLSLCGNKITKVRFSACLRALVVSEIGMLPS
jgi:hypothetical protein